MALLSFESVAEGGPRPDEQRFGRLQAELQPFGDLLHGDIVQVLPLEHAGVA